MITLEKYTSNILNIHEKNSSVLCENNTDETCICSDKDGSFRNVYKLQVHQIYHDGGVIVLFPGDLLFLWLVEESILKNITIDIVEWLQRHKVNAKIDRNDVMVDNYKLFGTMSRNVGNYKYEGMFISFNSDPSIIDTICNKPIRKVPKGLSKLGINRKEVISFIQELMFKYDLKEVK